MSEFFQAPLNHSNQAWNANAQGWGFGGHQGPYGQGGAQHAYGLGQAAFGPQNYGGAGNWSQGGYGNQGGFGGNQWQPRQLSHQDVGEIVRQLLPHLPQVVAQAQQPQAAFGYGGGFGQGGFGQGGLGQGGLGLGGFNQGQRHLSQQDVNEVVRQILPVIPQIVSLLQGQQQPYANAIHGGGIAGLGWANQGNQQGWGNQGAFGNQNWGLGGFGQSPFGLGQAAFGNAGGFGQSRQLNQADVNEVVRQLTAALPQVIANLQALNQQQQRPI